MVAAAIWFLGSMVNSQKKRIIALEYNESVLLGTQDSYRTKNQELVTQVNQLIATKEDLFKSDSLAKEKLKKMDVKVKNLQNYISLHLSSKDEANVSVEDVTIAPKDSILKPIEAKKFEYHTKWYNVNGLLVGDSVNLKISCYHEMDIANELIYKGWWIFKKPKELKTKVLLTNPTDTIEVVKSYKIVKNKLEKLLQ